MPKETCRLLRFAGMSRRDFLRGSAGLAALGLFPAARAALNDPPPATTLTAAEFPLLLPGCSAPSACWGYGAVWPRVLRIPRGETFTAVLDNRLPVHTSIHWHGLRIPVAMDGVPFMTQPPVEPGESFTYTFAPPDPGTFFFHPHCDTLTALSRGLAAGLIVEDPREEGLFDVDEVLLLKDWRARPDGSFDAFSIDQDAARAGTFGALRTTNGMSVQTIEVAPSARVRLRLINVDVTRIVMLGVAGAEAALIATDGNACPPMPVDRWRIGPAMRADIAFVAPDREGMEVTVSDVWPNTPHVCARIVTRGKAKPASTTRPLQLPPAELPVPDLERAQPLLKASLLAGLHDQQVQAQAVASGVDPAELCATRRIFWSINQRAWPGASHDSHPPPLFELDSGKTYVLEIFNGTPHTHPIHLHGHTFRVLSSNRTRLPPHWADTVLVTPKDRVRIAFVAGLPGDWMFHCHIIEHQETGMMGYLRVT
jgi:FtsP/CotA-like multicopper oxidase with cupredoxin domain